MEVYPYSITLKAPIMTAADDSLEYIFIGFFFFFCFVFRENET